MADELNTPTHRSYEPRNNVSLSPDDISKQWIYDSGIRKIDRNIASRLFSVPGSRGFFYDFSDYTTQFTDTAGTTPVTDVGQSVGLVLDESRGLALGPELFNISLNFSDPLWLKTASVSSSGFQTFTTNAANGGVYRGIPGVSSTSTYRVRVTGSTTTSMAIRNDVNVTGQVIVSAGSFDVTLNSQLFSGGSAIFFQLFAAGTATITSVSIRELPGNHATQATAGSRALTQVRPMFTQRNRAVGSELVENATYWPASSVQNGITATKVASGIDTDGLPYVDVRYQGTATGTSHEGAYPTASSRTPGAAGNQFTASVICRRVGGSLTGVSGLRTFVVEETAPSTFLGITLSALVSSTSDTEILATRTLSTGNQARTAVSLEFTNGATIDITYRIKGLQLELGSTRTTYQPAVSGERRNLVLGSGDPGNVTYWPISTSLNGISVTKIGFGLGADGLPYADYQVSGTAALASYIPILANAAVTNASGVGATYTFSGVAQIISGTIPPVGNRPRFEVIELASNQSFLIGTAGTGVTGTEQLFSVTRTTTDATIAFVRGGLVVETLAGSTVNYVFRAKALQFEQASTYSRYQRTITANEWYEPGFQSYRGIRFDGSDDFLQTAAIDFSNSDKMTVVAGVRKLSDAALSAVVEVGVGGGIGTAGLGAPGVGGGATYRFLSQGTIGNSANSAASFPAPDTAVITGLGDISGDSAILRRNGVQVAQNTADQGTGNFANDVVYIGRRGGTTLPFNGVLTFLCVINRVLTADDLALLETIANSRTGAY